MFARQERYAAAYTHLEPSRDDELRLLVEWIADQPGTGLLLVGPKAQSFEHSQLASTLIERRAASYTTWKNKNWWHHPRVVAIWPDRRVLQHLDDVVTIEALGVLPHGLGEVDAWAAGVGAVDLLGKATLSVPSLDDLVVLGALRSLTNSVNLSTGLSHPSDWDHAVETFRALRTGGHRIDANAIEVWAIANGWSFEDASDLAQLACEIAARKAKRTKTRVSGWRPTAATFEHWREIAVEADWGPF